IIDEGTPPIPPNLALHPAPPPPPPVPLAAPMNPLHSPQIDRRPSSSPPIVTREEERDVTPPRDTPAFVPLPRPNFEPQPISISTSLPNPTPMQLSSPPHQPSPPPTIQEESTAIEEELSQAMQVDSPPSPPSPRPASPSPPPLPRDFSSILGSIISSNIQDSGLVNSIMFANRSLSLSSPSSSTTLPPPSSIIRDLSNLDLNPISRASHDLLKPFLFESFQLRDRRRWNKMNELRNEYKGLNEGWRAHCKRLDKIKDRIHRRHNNQHHQQQPTSTIPATPSIDPAGLPFYPEPVSTNQGGPSIVARTNRRNANAAFGYGDAVRSEAEFLEILASLETADMRDPDVRATRTAAVVPDMVVDESEKLDILSIAFDDDRRIVDDPAEFYNIDAPLDLWTENEVHVFCKRFSQHPKQFGRIAADLPEKSTSQCVLFYYRMKNTIDFRSLSDRRGRDGRRRKTRRRGDADGGGKKASLLSNLKRARTDDRDRDRERARERERERDEEEDSPPPSPRAGRKDSQGPTSSIFPPANESSRPGPTPDELSLDEGGPSANGKGKKSKTTTPKIRDHRPLELASEGMVEAAEALGVLAALATGGSVTPLGGGGGDGEEADDDSTSKSSKKQRKVKLDSEALGDSNGEGKERSGAATPTTTTSAASRRKSASSSYWSVAERNEFVRLLGQFGKDWVRLAEGLENKTAVQCRNWFQNHAKKLNLAEIAKNADGNFDEDGDDDTGSGAATPSADFIVPTGVPLSEALLNGPAVPRAGFFVPDGSHPRVPSSKTPNFEEKASKAGMQIRNLLNEDTPDEEAPTALREGDWFGGGGEESATTEDESDAPKRKVNKSPPRRIDHQPSSHARTSNWDQPRAEDRRFAYEAPPQGSYRSPAQTPHYNSSQYPPQHADRYDLNGRSPVAWQPSSNSYPGTASSEYYSNNNTRPMDNHDRGGPNGQQYPSSRPDYYSAPKPHTYDRYEARPGSYPPPSGNNYQPRQW
ncbi:hypothetical protein P7C70_g8131, partial [Phenoliferia sp. Uapishka_3]